MSDIFDLLPDELIGLILEKLMYIDCRAFLNTSLACKRINTIAAQCVSSRAWLDTRPILFNFYLNPASYRLDEQYSVPETCQTGHHSDSVDCYRQRLSCIVTSKFINYSSLRFLKSRLIEDSCWQMMSIESCSQYARTHLDLKKKALVELELNECDISLKWLDTALRELPNVRYLTLTRITFIDTGVAPVPNLGSGIRLLKRLSIRDSRHHQLSDKIFAYFVKYLPAIQLDLRGTVFVADLRVIARFYGTEPPSFTTDLSDSILSKDLIQSYLTIHRDYTKRLFVNENEILNVFLGSLMLDPKCNQLQVIVSKSVRSEHFKRVYKSKGIWSTGMEERVSFEPIR